MKSKSGTETAITELIKATHGNNLTLREEHVFTEALRGLVRLAKAEQILEMKKDIKKSIKKTAVTQ